MKKKLLLTLLGVILSLPMFARDFEYEYEGQTLTYTVISEEDKTVMTKEGEFFNPGNNVSGELIIPEIAKDGDVEYSVTSIGEYAFRGCSSLTSVKIPDSVTVIGQSAFYCCNWLTSVIIPNSVTSIGKSAFYYCNWLTSVIIPNSVTSIGEIAFFGCWRLTSVAIGNSVTSIGESAFSDCSSLREILVEEDNQMYCSINGVLYNKDATTLLAFPGGKEGELVIPNFVTEIGDYAFSFCSSLTSVTIPNSVTEIGDYAFSYCSSLTSVTIPNSVTSIGNNAFSSCSSLTSVTIPNSVTYIGWHAFAGCISLTSVTIPNSVTSIREWTFSYCSSLTSVTIPNSVTSIGNYAFSNCSSLTSVIIPDSVTSIDKWAFTGCSSLTSVIIPNSVTEIGESAFSGCSRLTSVKLSDALTSIGEDAFAECNSISVVEYPSTTPIEAPGNVFATKVYDEAILYVPEGSKKTYEKTVPWNYFCNIEEKDFSATVAVSGLSFKQNSYPAVVGETINLNNEVVILPADATDKTLTWKSSDESVATVSNGIVTVLDEGTCQITATTTDGSNLSAVCTINATSGVATIATDELCDVYSLSGMLVERNIKLSEATSLAPGIYIVRQGAVVKKIAVK